MAEEDVDGAIPVDEHMLEPNAVDAWVQDQRETPWFWDGGPLVLPAEGDLSVRPGGILGQRSGRRYCPH